MYKKDLVESRVIFKGQKVQICALFHFRQFSEKLLSNFFSILAWTFPTNQLPKAGFDWIALKIFQGRKGLNLPLFSNFDT